jgi:hypothetical protein
MLMKRVKTYLRGLGRSLLDSPRPPSRRNPRRVRLRVEALEDRCVPSVLEGFEGGDLSAYTTVLRFNPSTTVTPDAAHDGGYGLQTADSDEWVVRNDAGVQVSQGQTYSVWINFAGAADGRAYFGFGAVAPGPRSQLDQDGNGGLAGTLSLVLAPNTGELQIQQNIGFKLTSPNGSVRGGMTVLGTAAQTYDPDHWYRAEVVWGTDNSITGNLYDSDGVTLLNTVTGTQTAAYTLTSGGIAFRGFGSPKYFDTVEVEDGQPSPHGPAGGPVAAAHQGNGHPSGAAAPTPGPGDPTRFLYQYQSVPGTGRDIRLTIIDQLTQVAIVGDTVGLTARNRSHNNGTVNVGWGPALNNLFRTDTPNQSPNIQWYVFRQLPGDDTHLIGSSGFKKFWDSSQGINYQFLPPGASDDYLTVHNRDQRTFSPAEGMDPVTGERFDFSYMGQRNDDGVWTYVPRTYTSTIENLLQIPVADLDPAQNPEGTRWFLAANIFVVGDEDVSNNSRWVEITPSFSGFGFTFTYPSGTAGQFDFRTIPGLVVPTPPGPGGQGGPVVVGEDPRVLSAVLNTLGLFTPPLSSRALQPAGSTPLREGQREALGQVSDVLLGAPDLSRPLTGGTHSNASGQHQPSRSDGLALDDAFRSADLFGGI